MPGSTDSLTAMAKRMVVGGGWTRGKGRELGSQGGKTGTREGVSFSYSCS